MGGYRKRLCWEWQDFCCFSSAVLASVPLCDITEEDLTQNPQFCKLLATLSQHVDRTGLTVPLKSELDKVPADTTHNGTSFIHAILNDCFLQRFLWGFVMLAGWAEVAEPEASVAAFWEPPQVSAGDVTRSLHQKALHHRLPGTKHGTFLPPYLLQKLLAVGREQYIAFLRLFLHIPAP